MVFLIQNNKVWKLFKFLYASVALLSCLVEFSSCEAAKRLKNKYSPFIAIYLTWF